MGVVEPPKQQSHAMSQDSDLKWCLGRLDKICGRAYRALGTCGDHFVPWQSTEGWE